MNITISAILFLCVCKLVFAIQDVIIKEMSDSYPVHQIMAFRSFVAILLLFAVIRFIEGASVLHNQNVKAQLLRGTLMFGSFTAFYLGLATMPLTLVTALFFTAPFFITLLSIPMLGEQVGPRRWIGITMGFMGVLIILRPQESTPELQALLPILSAFLYSISQIMARKLGIGVSAAVMTFYSNVAAAGLALVMAVIFMPFSISYEPSSTTEFLLRPWSIPNLEDTLLISLTGLTAAIGFWFSTQAYRISEVSKIAPFEYVMLIWVTLFGYLLWSEIPDLTTLTGTLIIVASGLYVIRREEVKTKRPLAYRGISRTR